MVQVYCEAYCRRHHARRLSAANAVLVGGHAAALALACLLAHASGGLWEATRTRVEQPRVAFAYDALLVMEGSTAGSEKVWSSFPGIRSTLGSKLVAAHMQASEHDSNFDGITDQITVDLLAKGVGDVHSLKLLLQFDYRLENAVRLRMSSLAYVHHSSPVPGFSLFTDGELQLLQKNPLLEDSISLVYSDPLLRERGINNTVFQAEEGLALETLISTYLDRNETTKYNYEPVWKSGSTQEFRAIIKIRIPYGQKLLLRVRTIGILKAGWMQILSLYVVLLAILAMCRSFLFHNRLLHTRVLSDLDPPKQRL